MNAPRHEMILASAGAGKTFALTDRFVQLLSLGAAPDRIVALTFTRKAAGEFFDGILNKLARAASEPAFARDLAARIGAPAIAPPQFLGMLRTVVDAMPRLSLGTFDSFFARIVRAFPLELGLGGDFELLQEHAALLERRRVLQRIFQGNAGGPDAAQLDFIEAFKRATFGLEEKRLASLLDRFLEQHHEVHLGAPDAALWGNPERIWPDGCAWLRKPGGAPGGVLREWALTAGIGDKQRERWLAFLAALETWAPGATPPQELIYVLDKALAAWTDLGSGNAVLEFDKKRQELSPAACAALRAIVLHVFSGELQRRLETTRGIHAVLAGYEAVYQDAVRRAGRLTFADVQRLLAPAAGAPTLSADTAAENRLLIDWRLDGQFEHWLLDEFQDTSHGQWSVLRNLIDEVVQDDSGRRTLFYVGDVKQAIYAWREGDSRLFREIFNHYNAASPGVIAERRLDRSWRSGPAILALVNRVFGASGSMRALFPAAAVDRWSREWRDHEPAVPGRPGQAAWLFAATEEERFATTLAVLREIRPLERGLSVAVLTQKNDTAARLADHLRREGGLRAVAESDLRVCTDNPAGAALLALFKAAAHPGDSLAWEHLRMTPLRVVLDDAGLHTHEAVTRALLREIHGSGFESVCERWLQRLEPHLAPDDAFSIERGRQMAGAARVFDERGRREVAEFIDFMERFMLRETDAGSVVRVMTIHKAKGLGFDVVILPDLEGDKLASRRDGLAVQKSPERVVEWVLDLPPKLFHSRDTVLAAHVESAEADACYDKLALLYVAMTRARHGLYLVTKKPGASKSHNFTRLLGETLGTDEIDVPIGGASFPGACTAGDPRWHEPMLPEEIAAAAPKIAPVAIESLAPVRRLVARTPSDTRAGTVSGGSLFSDGPERTMFGTDVHDLLATVAWWNPDNGDSWETGARSAGFEARAIACARACLDASENAAIFRHPASGTAELWRERAFEFAHAEEWITGKFDRVIVERAGDGTAVAVRVYDFKTGDAGTTPAEWRAAAARHAGQMGHYRRAAAALAHTSIENVSASIVLVNADPEGRRPPPVVVG